MHAVKRQGSAGGGVEMCTVEDNSLQMVSLYAWRAAERKKGPTHDREGSNGPFRGHVTEEGA